MLTVLILILLALSALIYVITPVWSFYLEIVVGTLLFVSVLKSDLGYRVRKRHFKLRSFGSPLHFAVYIGLFQVILLLSLGFVVGLGRSPYSHTPIMLMINGIFVLTYVLGREFSRAYILYRFRKLKYIIIIVAVLYTVTTLFPTAYYVSTKPLEILKYVGSNVIPTFTQQLFASILSYYAGAYASSLYFLVVMGFEWFSPVLPNLDWMLKSFLTTLAPAIGYLIMANEITIRRIKVTKKSEGGIASWIATFALCMLILLFFTGKLGYHPAVVGSGSMTPTICMGDIVIVKKVNPYDIHVGDIIQYRSDEGITITHRVIAIKETPNGLIFVTKGDANNVADKPFKEDRVIGKVVFVIPKLGLIPLMIRNLIWRMLRGG